MKKINKNNQHYLSYPDFSHPNFGYELKSRKAELRGNCKGY